MATDKMDKNELHSLEEKLTEVKKDFDFVSKKIGEKDPHDYRLHVGFRTVYCNFIFYIVFRNSVIQIK
jgi:hypothetical protein